MTREEAIERFNGIINAMSISIAQSKFYPSKAELNELCDMAIEALSERNIARDIATILENEQDMRVMLQNAENVKVVVRCKDCKWWHSNTEFCDVWSHMNIAQRTLADDYCSHAKRREL